MASLSTMTLVQLQSFFSVFFKIDCKTVRIFSYSSTREQSNERSGTKLKAGSETGERLSSHTPCGRVRLARFALKPLTPRLTKFFTDFEKKKRLFCSLLSKLLGHFLSSRALNVSVQDFDWNTINNIKRERKRARRKKLCSVEVSQLFQSETVVMV